MTLRRYCGGIVIIVRFDVERLLHHARAKGSVSHFGRDVILGGT